MDSGLRERHVATEFRLVDELTCAQTSGPLAEPCAASGERLGAAAGRTRLIGFVGECNLMMRSRSELSVPAAMGVQLRVDPDHRAGLRAQAPAGGVHGAAA
jgi:hypothetical protein